MDEKPKISVENLTLAYGETVIQSGLTFEVQRGEIFAIMGGSGCGKSTLLKFMIGLMPVKVGKVAYDGEAFSGISEESRAEFQKRFGILYQSSALWSSMSLAENIALPLRRYTDFSEQEIRGIAAYKLSLVGLAGYEDFFPSEISGGMKKRAGLARALALDPDLLFFDEPSAGLDPITSSRLDALIKELRDSLGTTVVMVTHELPSLFEIVDQAIFLDNETKTSSAFGDPRKLRDNPPNERVKAFLNRDPGLS